MMSHGPHNPMMLIAKAIGTVWMAYQTYTIAKSIHADEDTALEVRNFAILVFGLLQALVVWEIWE